MIKKTFHSVRRFLANHWLSLQPAIQIAITGSQGKTNTTQLIYKVLSSKNPTTVTDINLDTIYNTPITALKVCPWTKYVIFELGVDKPGEMSRHLEIVKPKIAVITGISPVHTDKDHLGSLDNLILEKRKLIESLPKNGIAILNGDDSNVRKMAKHTKAQVIFYGLGENNDIQAKNIILSLEGLSFEIITGPVSISLPPVLTSLRAVGTPAISTPVIFKLKTKLIGKHHAYNILAAYAVYRALGFQDNQSFQNIIESIKPLSGRMSLEDGPLGTRVLNDSLRANPASTASGLQTLSEIKYIQGRKIAVLAEMGELEKAKEEHQKIGQLVASLKINYLVAIGPLQKYAVSEAVKNGFTEENIFWVNNVDEAAKVLKKIVKKGDLIYLKGSLLRHVERVTLILSKKEVKCNVIVCHFYFHCLKCKYLKSGFKASSNSENKESKSANLH